MKRRVKTSICTLTLLSLLAASGCSGGSPDASAQDGAENKTIRVGIVQQMEHASLDEIHQGIVDAMADKGYVDGENIEIDFQNGQGDQSNLKTISQRFVNNECDIIVGIATAACQSVAAETETIPIVAAAVTDMEEASLVDSNEAPGGNVTGVSDMTPIKEQIDLLVQLAPETKTIGIAYCSSEVNSQVQAEVAKQYIDSIGLQYVEATVATVNDITQVLEGLAEKVEAVYVPVDNTLASSMPTVNSVCVSKGLPLVVGAAAMVEEGAMGSVAFNYYDVGYQSGEMAVRILEGADPATTPVETVQETQLYLSKTYADSIGTVIPAALLESAEAVY